MHITRNHLGHAEIEGDGENLFVGCSSLGRAEIISGDDMGWSFKKFARKLNPFRKHGRKKRHASAQSAIPSMYRSYKKAKPNTPVPTETFASEADKLYNEIRSKMVSRKVPMDLIKRWAAAKGGSAEDQNRQVQYLTAALGRKYVQIT